MAVHIATGIHSTPILGRDTDLDLVAGVLRQGAVRLFTLTGPGGVGKTRLAGAIAERMEDSYDDGVRIVDLAPLSDPALAATTIGAALGLKTTAEDPLRALSAYLSDRQLLLVLDNCEHLNTIAVVVSGLVTACPRLTVLATSRAPLGLSWEHRLAVQPLSVAVNAGDDVDTVLRVPAVALFVARARVADASFLPSPSDVRDIARLVGRLDGLPLAIEIAAARISLLSPAQLLNRLDEHLPLPALEDQDVPLRHRTLQAAIQWSYDQLSASDQALFRAVSVFTGHWSLEAVDAVAGLDPPELDLLSALGSLANLHLVMSSPGGDAPRFSMLQTVREFGLDQLAASADLAQVKRRHALYFAQLAGLGTGQMSLVAQERWANRLDAEQDDLRAALQWLLDHDRIAAGRLAVALGPFWWMKGYVVEGRRWLERALDVTPADDGETRANLLWLAGEMYLWQGQIPRGEQLHLEHLELAERLGDPAGIALALANLSAAAILRGDYEQARDRLGEATVYAAKADSPPLRATILRNQSWLEHVSGDQDEAARLHESATEACRQLGDSRDLALLLISFAEVEQDRGETVHAVALLREALRLAGDLRDRRTLGFAAQVVCAIVRDTADPQLVTHMLSASDTYYRTAGMPRDRVHGMQQQDLIAEMRRRLSPRFDELWLAGRDLPIEDLLRLSNSALDAAAWPPEDVPTARHDNPLTEREQQVLTLVAEGMPTKRIARTLGIGERTVKAHLTTTFSKLGAYSRGHAALLARDQGLI